MEGNTTEPLYPRASRGYSASIFLKEDASPRVCNLMVRCTRIVSCTLLGDEEAMVTDVKADYNLSKASKTDNGRHCDSALNQRHARIRGQIILLQHVTQRAYSRHSTRSRVENPVRQDVVCTADVNGCFQPESMNRQLRGWSCKISRKRRAG